MTTHLQQQNKLYAPACIMNVGEMLHIMSAAAVSPVSMTAVLDNHAATVAAVTDAQIMLFIGHRQRQARALGAARYQREKARLSKLASALRRMRDGYAAKLAVH
ncbi:MAG: hypothetical protein CR977_00095 [Gammaproteobacteria bacterium]|nr:MAG: hypothetical protein CR977_00095 [Gammaproteobacteria bacterium]